MTFDLATPEVFSIKEMNSLGVEMKLLVTIVLQSTP
jgi:hypothetical protein